jgi:hypothetical protein
LPAIVVKKTVCDDSRRRSDVGGGRWLKGAKEAKEAKKAKMQKAYRGHTEPRASHLYPDGKPMGGQKGRNSCHIQ